jgi:hypothetical protein
LALKSYERGANDREVNEGYCIGAVEGKEERDDPQLWVGK